MIDVPAFDVDALLQDAEHPLPAERDQWPRLFNVMRADLNAAVEHIELLEAALKEARSNA